MLDYRAKFVTHASFPITFAHTRSVVLLVAVAAVPISYCDGANEEMNPASLVEEIVSTNKPPRITKEADRQSAVVDRSFKWSEQDRVKLAIRRLISEVGDAWPEVVKHLDDDRYAITTDDGHGSVCNWTVGDVCRAVCTANLNFFESSLSKDMRSAKSFFHAHDPIMSSKDFDPWIRARAGVPLYKLQIERCEWAIMRIRERKTRGEALYVESLQGLAESIEKQKKPASVSKRWVELFSQPLTMEGAETAD